jgi:hypothetical protein
MKQKKGEDSKGRSILGKSKGFAFVALKDHPTTLKLLQNMNNNPNIFTEEKVDKS